MPLPPGQAECPSPRPSNLRCSSPCWCWGPLSGTEAGAGCRCGAGWGLGQWGGSRPGPNQPLSSRVLSPALGPAGESNLSPAVEKPIRRSLRQGGRGDWRGTTPPLGSLRLAPPPAPTPLPTHFHPFLLHTPSSQTHRPCCRGGRLPGRCMLAQAEGGPRHPGHEYARICAQHPSHPHREKHAPLTHLPTLPQPS